MKGQQFSSTVDVGVDFLPDRKKRDRHPGIISGFAHHSSSNSHLKNILTFLLHNYN